MPTLKLTQKDIDRARKDCERLSSERQSPLTELILWDTEVRGFACVVSPKGRATWLLYRRIGAGGRGAKQVKYRFGDVSLMPLDKARERAIELINDINKNIDPQQTKRQTRLNEHKQFRSGKLDDVFNLYLTKFKEDGRYWDEVEKRYRNHIIPLLGAQSLVAKITKQDIKAVLDSKDKTSKSGSRLTFAALSPFFKWCLSEDIVLSNPMAGIVAPVQADNGRERILSADEIKLFWQAASLLSYPWKPFYKLLLLTAQRRDEVAGLPWNEVNGSEWIIAKERTKNGKEHLVHLSPLAQSIIEDVLANAKRDKDTHELKSQFLFTKTNETHISGFSKAKLLLDAKIKELNNGKPIPDWRVHDLRRTAASGMAMLGIEPHIVERILNHVTGSTSASVKGINATLVRIYQRFEYADERRKAVLAWNTYLSNLTNPVVDTENVVRLHK